MVLKVCRSRLSVHGWIERDGSVLLTKVAPGYPQAGSWTLPGGPVEWGEHPEESLHRELYQGTGLKGSIDGQLGIESAVFEPNEFNGYTSLHIVRIIFRVSVRGTPRATETGGTTIDAAWLPLSNVYDLPTMELVVQAQKLADGSHSAQRGTSSSARASVDNRSSSVSPAG